MPVSRRMEIRVKLVGDSLMQWNYIGGLFDGEGCVWYSNGVRVSITNASLPLLKQLKGFLGYGSIRKDQRNSIWTWEAYGLNAHNFLCSMRHAVEIKKQQVELGIALRVADMEQRKVLIPALKGLKKVRYEN